jgi:hypothetical protein
LEAEVFEISDNSSASSEEQDDHDELEEDEDDSDTVPSVSPLKTKAPRYKLRNSNTTVKDDAEDGDAVVRPSNARRTPRKAKAASATKYQDEVEEDAGVRQIKATKKSPRKGKGKKKKEETPELPGVYTSKGQRILVAPYFDSLPSSLLQVSDPILEELDGELVSSIYAQPDGLRV